MKPHCLSNRFLCVILFRYLRMFKNSIKMKRQITAILWFLLLAFAPATTQAQDADAMTRLKKFFTNIANYNNNYSQEKVYLHLDNNGYFPNEKIWFKAYVFRASTLLPTDLSKVLYVELVTPEGEVKERQSLPIINGRTYGDFTLDNVFKTGFFQIRAYTRAMLNWDAAYVYSRVFPVFEVPKDTTQFSVLKVSDDPLDSRLMRLRKASTPLVPATAEKKGKMILTFYPEGGHLVKGVAGRVAYKLTDAEGMPLSTPLSICATSGTQLTTSTPEHEGMGVFEVPATWTGGFAKISDSKGNEQQFNLPQPQEAGCQMTVTTRADGGISLQAAPNNTFGNKILGISVTCRGVACYFDTIHVAGSTANKQIPRKALKDGIQQVTLFTPEGEIIAERLVWINPLQKPMIFEVKQSEQVYQPFSPIVLDFTLKDPIGTPQQGEFSLSVQDVGGMVADDGMSLKTDMILCSDLKGYIHQPEYYFEKDDAEHLHALDLLMMVQGWRRYEWKEMAGIQPFVLKQPAEDHQLIDGRIVNNTKDKVGMPNLNVNLMIILNNTFTEGTALTDQNGNFALQLKKDFYNNGLGYFTITEKNDKRQNCSILLNRNFKPDILPYEPQQLLIAQPQTMRQQTAAVAPTTFAWTDTITKIHYLPEAKVTEKMKHLYGSRYTYLGGENTAKMSNAIYYNVEDEMEKWMDAGRNEPLLWDWLKERNPYFEYDINVPIKASLDSTGNSYELRYKNRPVIVWCDNRTSIQHPNNDYLGNDIRSLYIIEDQEAIVRIHPESSSTHYSVPPVLFMLYSEIGKDLTSKYKKGVRATILHGFSKAEDFYSPNYRMEARPSSADARRTLYWNPALVTDKSGKANVILYSNFRKDSHIHINAQGITATGALFGTE
jgi:hypothetical protein